MKKTVLVWVRTLLQFCPASVDFRTFLPSAEMANCVCCRGNSGMALSRLRHEAPASPETKFPPPAVAAYTVASAAKPEETDNLVILCPLRPFWLQSSGGARVMVTVAALESETLPERSLAKAYRVLTAGVPAATPAKECKVAAAELQSQPVAEFDSLTQSPPTAKSSLALSAVIGTWGDCQLAGIAKAVTAGAVASVAVTEADARSETFPARSAAHA